MKKIETVTQFLLYRSRKRGAFNFCRLHSTKDIVCGQYIVDNTIHCSASINQLINLLKMSSLAVDYATFIRILL